MTPADVERLNSARRKQDEQLAAITELKNETESRVWKQETDIEKKLADLESAVRDYMRQAESLQLVGPSSRFSQMNFALSVNTKAARADDLLSVNVTEHIRPALQAIIDKVQEGVAAAQSEMLALTETLTKLEEMKSEKTDDISIMETKIDALEKQYQEEKEVGFFDLASETLIPDLNLFTAHVHGVQVPVRHCRVSSSRNWQAPVSCYRRTGRPGANTGSPQGRVREVQSYVLVFNTPATAAFPMPRAATPTRRRSFTRLCLRRLRW